MTNIHVDVLIKENRWSDTLLNGEEQAKDIIENTLKIINLQADEIEISCVLDNDAGIQVLNKTYRGKDAPTNVLSFCQTEQQDLNRQSPYLCLGDIILSYETLEKEAHEQNKSFTDHFTHILVHGCLHLIHYDHETDAEAEEMEALEVKILEQMNVKNPYETF